MTIAAICVSLLGLLLFGLGLSVSAQRRRSGIHYGSSGAPTDPLFRLVRAHGNTAEYAPMLAVLMLLAAHLNPATWVLGTMALATLLRYVQAIGLAVGPTLDTSANKLRFVGSLGTYICGVLLSVAVLMGA